MTKVVINKDKFKVNGGKEFELPEMTNRKHEAILAKLASEKDKYTNFEYAQELQKEMIVYILKEVDDSVTRKKIDDFLHPQETTDLADAIWEEGRTHDVKKFRVEGSRTEILKIQALQREISKGKA